MNILVVDDEKNIAYAIAQILKNKNGKLRWPMMVKKV